MDYWKRKKITKSAILIVLLFLLLALITGCDSDDSKISKPEEYTVEIAGVKESQDIEAFTVVYNGDEFLEFNQDNYDEQTKTLGAVVVSSTGEFELEIDQTKLAEDYDPNQGYINSEAMEKSANNKKEFTVEWTYFVENEQDFETVLNSGLNTNGELIEHLTFRSDLTGDFNLTEEPRDIVINAENFKLDGDLNLGDGSKDINVEIRNFIIEEPHQLNLDLKNGELIIKGSTDTYGILINSVGSNSLELRDNSRAEWIRNNHEGANIKLLENSYVDKIIFGSSGSLQGKSRVAELEKTSPEITISYQDDDYTEDDYTVLPPKPTNIEITAQPVESIKEGAVVTGENVENGEAAPIVKVTDEYGNPVHAVEVKVELAEIFSGELKDGYQHPSFTADSTIVVSTNTSGLAIFDLLKIEIPEPSDSEFRLIFSSADLVGDISSRSFEVIAKRFAGGDGTAESPYQIENWYHLENIRLETDKFFRLSNDLNSSTDYYDRYAAAEANGAQGWQPILDFNGVFDGDYYLISDLYINRLAENKVGLFGNIINKAVIKNIGLENIDITGRNSVGGVVGYLEAGSISNSFTSGEVTAKGDEAGGLTAFNNGFIENSYSEVNVKGLAFVGGLAGRNDEVIANCYAEGNVVSGQYYMYVGGFVGANNGNIRNSYSLGTVSGGAGNVGGFVGFSNSGGVVDSYWDIESSGKTESFGGEARTTAQLKEGTANSTIDNQAVYTSWGYSIWDFGTDSDYPKLRW